MSWLNDKIVKGGEVSEQGNFTPYTRAFYVFLAPKSETYNSVEVINAKVSQNEDAVDMPFAVGVWNPIVCGSINVTSDLLSNYRVFWGAEN